MANCIYCQAETILYVNGRPICLSCSDDIDAGRKPPSRECRAKDEPKSKETSA